MSQFSSVHITCPPLAVESRTSVVPSLASLRGGGAEASLAALASPTAEGVQVAVPAT